MATSSAMAMTNVNGMQSSTANGTTVIQVNDHEISNEDATWQAYTGNTDEQQPATFWTRINRLVKIAFGYSTNNSSGVSGVAIPDPYNV